MTDKTASSKSSRSSNLKSKIEKSQERFLGSASIQKAVDATGPAREAVTKYAKKHPVATVAGGVVVGLILGRLLPRSFGRKLVSGAVTAATLAGEAGLLYGAKAGEAAAAAGSSAAAASRSGLREARRQTRIAGTRARGAGLTLAGQALKLAARARR